MNPNTISLQSYKRNIILSFSTLNENIKRFKLLFRAFEYQFKSKLFHNKCDNIQSMHVGQHYPLLQVILVIFLEDMMELS